MDYESEIKELKRIVNGNGRSGLDKRVTEMEVKQKELDKNIEDIHSNTKVLIQFMTQEKTRDKIEKENYNKFRDNKSDRKWLIGLTIMTFLSSMTMVLNLVL